MKKMLIIMLLALPYFIQAQTKKEEIYKAVDASDLNKVKELIEADPTLLESKDDNGYTPLHKACFTGKVTIANFLLVKGANVKALDNSGFTPLHRACYFPGQDTTLIQSLIDKGADVNALTKSGFTPLHWAAFRGGFKVAKFLLGKGVDVNVQGNNGITPLHRAAQSGDPKVAKLLIDNGADVNIYDKYNGPVRPNDINGTVLQVAINFSPNEETAKLLVEGGAKLNKKDYSGNTELHLAVLKGYSDLAKLLVQHGADVNAVNQYNRTAFYYAAKHGYRSVADVLIAAGAKTSSIVETNYGKAPQLTETLKDGEANIWSLDVFSYAVKTKGHLVIFNLRKINESLESGLANGNINPNELEGQKTTVLITDPERWQNGKTEAAIALAKRIPGTDFVLSYKPAPSRVGNMDVSTYHLAVPNENFSVDGILVHTISALGDGMGYLVEVDGVKIFHAGLHVSDNEPSNLAKYQKEIDFLKPFGPIDIVILSVYGHNNRVGTAYEPYLYLLDQLLPKTIFLTGANNPEQYPKCVEALRVRNIPISFPEGGLGNGDRFHYQRDLTKK